MYSFLFKVFDLMVKSLSLFILKSDMRKIFRRHCFYLYKFWFLSKKTKDVIEYKFVSLGYNCFPRWVLTELGLKPSKKQGELSFPFDLSVHPANCVIDILENEFDKYFEGLFYNFDLGCWANSKYNIIYNHDKDCSHNERGKFCNRYMNRIANLKSLLKNNSVLCYFVIAAPRNEYLVNKLYKVLRKLRNNLNFRLIVLDMECVLNKRKLNPAISVFQIHHPYIDMNNWWKVGFIDSKAGEIYCALIADFIIEQVSFDFELKLYNNKREIDIL